MKRERVTEYATIDDGFGGVIDVTHYHTRRDWSRYTNSIKLQITDEIIYRTIDGGTKHREIIDVYDDKVEVRGMEAYNEPIIVVYKDDILAFGRLPD